MTSNIPPMKRLLSLWWQAKMLNPVRKLTDNMGGDEDQSIGFEPEEESTNFYHPGFGIKVALRNYAPVPHLLPILRHLRGNLFSFYRGKVQNNAD